MCQTTRADRNQAPKFQGKGSLGQLIRIIRHYVDDSLGLSIQNFYEDGTELVKVVIPSCIQQSTDNDVRSTAFLPRNEVSAQGNVGPTQKRNERKKGKKRVPGRRVGISCMWKSVPTEGTVYFSSSYSLRFRRRSFRFPVRALRHSIFFYHLIKQPVTRNTQSPTTEKAVFQQLSISAALRALSLFLERTFVESTDDYFPVDKAQ